MLIFNEHTVCHSFAFLAHGDKQKGRMTGASLQTDRLPFRLATEQAKTTTSGVAALLSARLARVGRLWFFFYLLRMCKSPASSRTNELA